MPDFVDHRSIVRTIWGNPDLVLLIFAGSAAEFALNRAVAVAELDGPELALTIVDRLEAKLVGYYAYQATRADLLRRLGRIQESRAAYARAIALTANSAEVAYLTRRRDQLAP